jgi:myosin regulatory light chain 12
MMDGLLSDRPGSSRGGSDFSDDRGINFTMFLTMMGEHLFEFDPEQDLLEAFECFDESDSGFVKCDEVRRWMADVGERMDTRDVRVFYDCLSSSQLNVYQIDRFLKGPFTDRQGNFNYREWVKVLRVNAENEEAETPA